MRTEPFIFWICDEFFAMIVATPEHLLIGCLLCRGWVEIQVNPACQDHQDLPDFLYAPDLYQSNFIEMSTVIKDSKFEFCFVYSGKSRVARVTRREGQCFHSNIKAVMLMLIWPIIIPGVSVTRAWCCVGSGDCDLLVLMMLWLCFRVRRGPVQWSRVHKDRGWATLMLMLISTCDETPVI